MSSEEQQRLWALFLIRNSKGLYAKPRKRAS